MPQHLVIITNCVPGTQGDPSAAFKLINDLLLYKPSNQDDIAIDWIICDRDRQKDFTSCDSYIKPAQQLGMNLVFSDSMTSNVDDLIIERSNLICYFPCSQTSIPGKVAALSQYLKKPTLLIGEYNLDYWNINTIRTGLGPGRLGIFLETPKPMQCQNIKSDVLELLGLTESVAKYTETHQLYFGYFNKDYDSANRTIVNPQNFIKTCLHLAMLKKPRHVDFVVRRAIYPKDLPLQLLANSFSCVEIINNSNSVSIIQLNSDTNLPKIRIIDCFPLDKDVFQFLLSVAEPFMALTGDQSFTEGINRSAIIFYEAMSWKQALFDEFVITCSWNFPNAKELNYFNELLMATSITEDYCKQLAHFIYTEETKILEQMRSVTSFIQSEYNLSKNLAYRIYAAMNDPSRIEAIFSGYSNQPKLIEISNYIAENVQYDPNCKSFLLNYRHVGSSGTALVACVLEDKPIEELLYKKNLISDFGAGIFARLFVGHKTLRSVDLSDNQINEFGIAIITQSLQRNSSIKKLKLSCNNITDVCAIFFKQMLENNTTLEGLDLSHNEIHDPGALLFAEGLMKNKSLKHLNLADNGISKVGAADFEKTFNANTNLEEINLKRNFSMPKNLFKRNS